MREGNGLRRRSEEVLLLAVLCPNDCFILFSQPHEECELKIIEQEKEVTVLPPKEACKCHKEDLAEALKVGVPTSLCLP